VSNETERRDVFFDNIVVQHYPGPLVEETHYYPFGLTMTGISSNAANMTLNKEKTFQGQRFDDELGLKWIQFKWRNHDPQIGRFFEIDPLAEDYEYNSTYAFSENKVTNHIELEGLEAVSAGAARSWLGAGFGQITEAIGRGIDNFTSFFTRSETEVSKPSSITNASTTFTTTTTTEYRSDVFGWIQSSKKSNATVSNGPSIFKADSKTEFNVGLNQELEFNQGTASLKTALDGSSMDAEFEGKANIRGVPVIISASNSQNFQTGENKTKIRTGIGSNTHQAYSQIEMSRQNRSTKTNISLGLEVKTNNVKRSISIGKSF
jgi:RHS repeat-associated protein